MSDRQAKFADIGRLTSLMLEGAISADDRCRLEQLLLNDPEAQAYYENYIDVHSLLHWVYCPTNLPAQEGHDALSDDASVLAKHSDSPAPVGSWDEIGGPAPSNLSLASAIGQMPHVKPFSYVTSLVMVLFAAMIAWEWKVADCRGFSETGVSLESIAQAEPFLVGRFGIKSACVGRVTGISNCRWAAGESAPARLECISAGRRFKLESGLLEITYASGAKVLIQGPAVYEVCTNGGLLISGKLTGKLELSRPECRAESQHPAADRPTCNDQTPEAACFAIRTPTAVVLDLGTEFAVEVDREGDTLSHVFHGCVHLQPLAISSESKAITLQENESALIERIGSDRIMATRPAKFRADGFIREMNRVTPSAALFERPAG